jgi:hypothetical protein
MQNLGLLKPGAPSFVLWKQQAWAEAYKLQFGVSGIRRLRCIQRSKVWAESKDPPHAYKANSTFPQEQDAYVRKRRSADNWSRLSGNLSLRTCPQGRSATVNGNSSGTWREVPEDRYDWWPKPILEGYVLLLLKSMYETRKVARKWHH